MMNKKHETISRRHFLGAAAVGTTAFALVGRNTIHAATDLHEYGPTLQDRLWMWGHETETIQGHSNIPKGSTIGQADAIKAMGIPNNHVVHYLGKPDYPFDEFIKQFRNTKRVTWNLTGGDQDPHELKKQRAFELIDKMPNLVGFSLDDFFNKSYRLTVDQLRELRKELDDMPRKLNLSVVFYTFELELKSEIKDHFDYIDDVLLWTWHATDLVKLEENFKKYRNIVPNKPTWLGIYMWDFGNGKPITMELMKLQLDFALEKFKQGEIEGMIFHCTPLVNLDLEAVKYSKKWIAEHANVGW